MVLKSIELSGFKSFAKKSELFFEAPVTAIVGPNGSGKSNVVESIRFVLGEQSMKSLRGKGGSDLIFKGSKNLSALSRASVTIVFDNTGNIFTFSDTKDTSRKNISYDEVRITREVYADGSNKYLINSTEVRLKDIIELLASVHIGASGHHIISQGEADRILSSNAKERRLMIEDALGLKIYQFRIKESERRLEKTEANMKEIAALKRELAPHLQYLKKQVEKIEKTQSLREELRNFYLKYGAYESFAIATLKKEIQDKKTTLENEFNQIQQKVSSHAEQKESPKIAKLQSNLDQVVLSINSLEQTKNELERSLGRLEGASETLKNPKRDTSQTQDKLVPFSYVKDTLISIKKFIQSLSISEVVTISTLISKTLLHIDTTIADIEGVKDIPVSIDHSQEINKINEQIQTIETDIKSILTKKTQLFEEKVLIEQEIQKETELERVGEREYYEVIAHKNTLESKIREIHRDFDDIVRREESFENELREGIALLGQEMPRQFEPVNEVISTPEQIELKRKIERIKIKIEESGGLGGTDTIKEYESTKERDEFLAKELDDLNKSIVDLRSLITDLKVTLDTEFKNGIEKINTVFEKFFNLMFGGGNAHLSISVEHKRKKKNDDEETSDIEFDEEEMDFERGIDIHVSLPHKKIKELSMLSGGERSLTSIALLFAMSQVNPPPFLVLDETDAALDEANSRRYGDMIESLSKVSQLIVVTHNRETMSRANILYGVTVGTDGGSKLLSIKFDDATAYAK